MTDFVAASLLYQGQVTATPTTAIIAALPTELTRIVITNATGHNGSATDFSIFHNVGNTAVGFTSTNALHFHEIISKQKTAVIAPNAAGLGMTLAKGDSLGVAGGTAAPVTVTIYGVTRIGR